MTITVEKAFKLYMAVRLHFLHDYDVWKAKGRFKWQGKVMSRQDVYLTKGLIAIAPEPQDFIELCVCNFLYGNDNFLYGQQYTEENYKRWRRVKESITYTLQSDVDHILNWIDHNHVNPILETNMLRAYVQAQMISDLLSGRIRYESVIIMQRYIPILDMITGFNAESFKTRMRKANKFVTAGKVFDLHREIVNNLKEIKTT